MNPAQRRLNAKWITCPPCRGSGYLRGYGDCYRCGGNGTVTVHVENEETRRRADAAAREQFINRAHRIDMGEIEGWR